MNSRIVLINNNPPHSGTGRYAYSLLVQLSRVYKGHINFVGLDKQLFDPNYYKLRSELRWLYYMLKLRILAGKLINRLSYDSLVHATNAGYLASIIPAMKKRYSIVVTVHDLIPFFAPRSVSDAIVRKAFMNVADADKVIVPSESTKHDLLRIVDINSQEVKVIYYGIDHALFKPRCKLEARRRLGLPLDKPIILNVGSEEPRKNVPTLLEAFKKLLNDVPDALLMRIGERTARIGKIINALGLTGRVFYSKADQSKIGFYYNAADLLAFPSYCEGFGNPPLEAMSSGCPVIAGNRTSVPEVVGDAGILLNPFDVDGFAYWMREVLTNEDLEEKLSRKGLERSMIFRWEKCARETLEVYKEVLGDV
jgi:glycosyltransferase involved in cell wall biosynthesis